MNFDIYATPMALPYPMYGPPVYKAAENSGLSSSSLSCTTHEEQTLGLAPADCVAVNGNWCGIELSSYTNETECWNASAACWNQSTVCYATAQPTGYQGCKAWEAKCDGIDDACNAKNFTGPPSAGKMLTPAPAPMVGSLQIVKGRDVVEHTETEAPKATTSNTVVKGDARMGMSQRKRRRGGDGEGLVWFTGV